MFPRNPRHNPYLAVEGPAWGPGVLTRVWRWRTEIALLLLAAGAAAAMVAAMGQGLWWAAVAVVGTGAAPATVPAGRKWILRHFWCLFSRHRMQRVCMETSMHTRAGRIPLILWMTPTDSGERAFILLRAGICADDFEAFGAEIAAACCASHVRVRRHPDRAQFLTVDIVRRDPERRGAAAGAWDGGRPGATRPLEKLAG
ncbi:hypothetical protein FAF44_38905 [Nonomuraea sp. MG754425]|uniref:hypothetical protein n=1 Tax=Nonomuraea sp. MG754425 TaxID=2570319 RepID=UPI001F29C561|nr:hypothetical protein [Nonomuraea sp. MG754425]MCF6474308.1 hypothetical protein [Nonomuraea sp. MG754425]